MRHTIQNKKYYFTYLVTFAFAVIQLVHLIDTQLLGKLNLWYQWFDNKEMLINNPVDYMLGMNVLLLVALLIIGLYCKKKIIDLNKSEQHLVIGVLISAVYIPMLIQNGVKWLYIVLISKDITQAAFERSLILFYLIVALIGLLLIYSSKDSIEKDKKDYLTFLVVNAMIVVNWFLLILNIVVYQFNNIIVAFDQSPSTDHLLSVFDLTMIIMTILALSVVKNKSLFSVEKYVRSKDVFICLGLSAICYSSIHILPNIMVWFFNLGETYSYLSSVDFDALYNFELYDKLSVYIASNQTPLLICMDYVASLGLVFIHFSLLILGVGKLRDTQQITDSRLYFRSLS